MRNNSDRRDRRLLPVYSLCVTQVIAWGSLYYAFSVLLGPMSNAHGWPPAAMVGAFSLSLLVSGLAAYPAGRLLHRYGGRAVMGAGSAIAAIAFLTVAVAPALWTFYLGWAIAGVAMALSLYEAAFAVLAMHYVDEYRRAVTTVTLSGGFASTVFWPLTERLVAWTGWFDTLCLYAALHLFVCLPLHLQGLPAEQQHPQSPQPARTSTASGLRDLIRQPQYWFLTGSFTLNSIVFAVVAVHLIPLLQEKGLTLREAAWMAAAAGPMQVLGRVLEFGFASRWETSRTGLLSMALTIPSMLGLAFINRPVSHGSNNNTTYLLLAAISLYGVSNGVMTIVRSLSIVGLFGRHNYARVSGAITGPGAIARAIGPTLASSVVALTGSYKSVLLLLAAIGTLALLSFWQAYGHRTPPPETPR
jgi:MFS family permease